MSYFRIIFPEGKPSIFECSQGQRVYSDMIDRCVREHTPKITTSRFDPKPVVLTIEKQQLKDNELVFCFYELKSVMPPIAPITSEEFEREESRILAKLPPEFRSAVSVYAYEQSHSYGMDEVLSKVEDIVLMLEEPARKFFERLRPDLVYQPR